MSALYQYSINHYGRAPHNSLLLKESHNSDGQFFDCLHHDNRRDVPSVLGTYMNRYPYLYGCCPFGNAKALEESQMLRESREYASYQFGVNLCQYVLYCLRLKENNKNNNQRIPTPINNPTLLSNPALFSALKYFNDQVVGCHSHYTLAQQFLVYIQQPPSYRVFKRHFYDYLTMSIQFMGKMPFAFKLDQYLQNTLSQCEDHTLDDFLLVRTCSLLLNFLIVDNSKQHQHFVLIDLLSNLGVLSTVGMFLKVILLCRAVKPHLDKRLSILCDHYWNHDYEDIQWLIQILEYWNIALSTNLGSADMSYVRQFL